MNTALDTKLLPCPHCGGDAELDTGQAYRCLSDGAIGSRAVVYCTRCGADAGFCYEDARGTPREDIVNQVVDDWNRRVSPSQGEGPVADVVERTSNPGERREIQFHLDRLNAWLTELWAANNLTLHMCNGTVRTGLHGLLCDIRDDVMAVRDALASLAPRGAQGAPADEQSGEKRAVAWGDAGPIPGHHFGDEFDPAPSPARGGEKAVADARSIAEIIDPHSFMDIPFTDDPVLLDMVEQSKQDAIRKAERILSRLRAGAQEGWRSAKDELPPLNQVVIVCRTSGYDDANIYSWGARVDTGEGWLWGIQSGYSGGVRPDQDATWNDVDADDEYPVTHWMPLPAAPSPEEGGRS